MRHETTPSRRVGIAGVSYHLPAHAPTLAALARDGLIAGDTAPLASFGFANARVARGESHVEMAVHAARAVLEETGTDPADVGLVLYAGALVSSAAAASAPPPAGSLLNLTSVPDLFRYPASMLHDALDLEHATVTGIGQQGCAAMFTAIQVGRAALLTDPRLERVLCVGSDRLPDGVPRDIIFNLVSDGAAAVLLGRNTPSNSILATHTVSKPMLYGDASLDAEVIAAYFPTAARAIDETLARAGMALDDITLIIPHNVSLRSWEILLGMLRVPREKLFTANIPRLGHTMSADNLINLRDAQDSGLLRAGDKLLLFTFGFGLHWSCMVLEH